MRRDQEGETSSDKKNNEDAYESKFDQSHKIILFPAKHFRSDGVNNNSPNNQYQDLLPATRK